MRGSISVFVLGAITLAFAPGAGAQDKPGGAPSEIDPAKRAAIEELFTLMKLDEAQKQMLPQVQKMMTGVAEKALPKEMQNSPDQQKVAADIRDFENRIFDMMTDHLDFAKMKPEYVKLYDETFSSEEIAGIVTFYKSQAGQAYVAKMPVLSTKTIEMSQRMVADLIPELQQMNADWTEEMRKKYSQPPAK
jgi:uncharacterized protein